MKTELLKRVLAFRGLSDEDVEDEPDEDVDLDDDDDDLDEDDAETGAVIEPEKEDGSAMEE